MPAFVATLSICIVFIPIFFLKGAPGYLFRPLAEAVVFAMLASYFLSRTLVPTLVMYSFRSERRKREAAARDHRAKICSTSGGRETKFRNCAGRYNAGLYFIER